MPNPNLVFSNQLTSSFADLGLEHVCISPGSRNTPLIAAFATQPRIRAWSILDERSAAFFAIGIARATSQPVAVVCTSGTAAAQYHPAVIEASQSEIPLLLLTADRPAELRGVGAPQTIDQIDLYGSSTRLFIDVASPDASTTQRDAADVAVAAWSAATDTTPGPVHLNLQFREPLLTGEPVGKPIATDPPAPMSAAVSDFGNLGQLVSGRNGIIVAGRCSDPAFPPACTKLAAVTGFPIVADPLSGLRFGDVPPTVLAAGDALAAAGALDRLVPDLVIRFGPVPTSKPTWAWLEQNSEIEQILIDVAGRDATRSASRLLNISPATAAAALATEVTQPAPATWTAAWLEGDRLVRKSLDATIEDARFPNEPAIAQIVIRNAPTQGTITVGSSMPIRDVDRYCDTSSPTTRVFGNRGTNGIDGVVSAALGSAATGQPATVLLGDVSMFHDLNALGTAAQLGLPITIVVVHNDGGGIFHFLPHRDAAILPTAAFDQHLATPHGTDFVSVASSLGLEAHYVDSAEQLAALVKTVPPGPRLLELRTNAAANLDLHRRISKQVDAALAKWPPTS